jgi:hypothetical protein
MLKIVKEETLELPKIEYHQDDNIITYIDKIYKESFSKFIYFCWITKSEGLHRSLKAQAQCITRYIPTSKFIYFCWIAKLIVSIVGKKIVGQS